MVGIVEVFSSETQTRQNIEPSRWPGAVTGLRCIHMDTENLDATENFLEKCKRVECPPTQADKFLLTSKFNV